MAKVKDISGLSYGRLTVLSLEKIAGRKTYWLCKCVCGNETVTRGDRLRQNRVKSCGCHQKQKAGKLKKKPDGTAGFNRLTRTYRYSAIKRGYTWELSTDELKHLFTSPCFYCGISPVQVIEDYVDSPGKFLYNGIDRLDNNIGYQSSNVVPCCKTCNRAKHTMSITEFQTWLNQLYSYMKSKNEDILHS